MSADTAGIDRAVAWVKDDPFGVEFAEIRITSTRMTAVGVAIGTAPLPYRLDYELETSADFVTARLRATSRGAGWHRELELRRSDDGAWSIEAGSTGSVDLPRAGGEATQLAQALDCDLELSPVTNTMPVLRHGLLHGGGPVELTMAWIAVPALSVGADRQRYRHVAPGTVRFEAVDASFVADIALDADAIVIDYPGIARRLGRALLRRDEQRNLERDAPG